VTAATPPALNITSPAEWASDFLSFLAGVQGLPAAQLTTPSNEEVVDTWEAAEGGNWQNTATYNPLDTSEPEPGATPMSPGSNIKAYTSWQQGLDATVATLLGGQSSYGYGPIVTDLDASAAPATTAGAIQTSAWDAGGYPASSPIGQLAGGGPPTPASGSSGSGTSATLTGLSLNPASDIASALDDVLGAVVAPLKAYLEDAGLVILGLVILVVGLVVIAHAGIGAATGATARSKATRQQVSSAQKEARRYRSSSPAPARAPAARAPSRAPRQPRTAAQAATSAPSAEGAEVALAAA
jgi:hypothetical protein